MDKRSMLNSGRLQAKLIRRTIRRNKKRLQSNQPPLNASPVFFANSFPKSGTHLLTQILKGFTQIGPAVESGLPAIVTFDGKTGRQRSENEILNDLKRLLPGDIAYGHLHAFPDVVNFLSQTGFATYFILRDPRDVAVSHVHYVTEMEPKHAHHHYYRDVLEDFDHRLQASIEGIPSGKSRAALPNIAQRFKPYLEWLNRPEILTIHFEDLISKQEEALQIIFNHAVQHNFKPIYDREQAINILSQSINPQRSPTFRSGKIGAWQSCFKENHKQVFKDIAGDLLVQLDYEDNLDW
jgi:hypothetical protein